MFDCKLTKGLPDSMSLISCHFVELVVGKVKLVFLYKVCPKSFTRLGRFN